MMNCSFKTFQVYHTMYSAMFVIVLLTWLGLLVIFYHILRLKSFNVISDNVQKPPLCLYTNIVQVS